MKQQGFSESLRLMRVRYGLRFVVNAIMPGHIVLVVLNRKVFDSLVVDFLTEAVEDCLYDTEERLVSFYLNGMKFTLLSKEGCG